MNSRDAVERYNPLQITLHWAMLLLLAVVYACIELKGFFPKGSDAREALKSWHFMLGLTVFVFAIVRLVAHLVGSKPVFNQHRSAGRQSQENWSISHSTFS